MIRALCLCLPLLLCLSCSSRPAIIVYSPHGREMLGDYEKLFEAANPGVDLQWLDMGANDAYARIGAEKARPACDVWWGAPSTMFERAAADGLLDPYKPAWAAQIDPSQRDPQDLWYATFVSPLAIVFNTNGLTRDKAPQTWDALLDPQWKGKIALRKPLPSGTMRTFFDAMILRAPSEDAGIDWLKRLHANTSEYPESPELLYDHIKKNPEKVAVWLMPDAILQRERNGYPFDYALPPDTPVLTDCIGIVKGAPHAELARKFYEFVTSKEALLHQAKSYAKLPARKDISVAELPPALAAPVQAMSMDWKRVAEKEKDWCARWQREVYDAAKAGR